MPENKTNVAWINEAYTLVKRLVPIKHKLRENECGFVLELDEKLKAYGYGTRISDKQMAWLRLLEKAHVPDERQMNLLGS